MKKKQILKLLEKIPDDFEVVMAFNGCAESGEFLTITEIENIEKEDSKHPEKEKMIILYSNRARSYLKYPVAN